MENQTKQQLTPKQQLIRIVGVTGWSRDHLADLLGISNFSMSRYLSGLRKPTPEVVEKISYLYAAIIIPLDCDILRLRNTAEKHLLSTRIRNLNSSTPPSCPK